ncbi:MAG: Uma2 family endonuclease [Planctomycetales bacterium]|nr:Uma2 family endonuclease [Planctomycetales bacterium]
MSAINKTETIEYPETDGQPMGETETHRRWMTRIDDILCHRLRGLRAYVGCNLLLYYLPGQPARFVVPDNFVVLDCDPRERRIFKTWEEERVPDVIIEVTSLSTQREDQVKKLAIYEEMGAHEYFLYDPTASYLTPSLQGFRLVNSLFTEIEPQADGRLRCETLGLDLQLSGQRLEIIDSLTGQPALTEAEENWQRAESETQRAEMERAARLTAEKRIQELEEQLRKKREEP